MNNLSKLKLNPHSPSNANLLLNSLNINQMQTLVHQIDAEIFWNKRNPSWYQDTSRSVMSWLRKIAKIAKKRIKTDRVKKEYSSLGSIVTYSSMGFLDGPSTFENHFLLGDGEGWVCLYMDAYCAGWSNSMFHNIITYTEGDVTKYDSPTETVFNAELEELLSWAKNDGYTVSKL